MTTNEKKQILLDFEAAKPTFTKLAALAESEKTQHHRYMLVSPELVLLLLQSLQNLLICQELDILNELHQSETLRTGHHN